MKRLLAGLIAGSLLTWSGCSAAASRVVEGSVEKVGAGGNSFKIRLQADSSAPMPAIWKALTDYDHHADYLPYLKSSKVIYRNAEYNVIDQTGQCRILFWTFVMNVKQKVREAPPDGMKFQAIDGDFTQLDGEWRLAPTGAGGTHLFCEFSVQPRRRVPGWAVRIATQRYLARMIDAICRRAETKPG